MYQPNLTFSMTLAQPATTWRKKIDFWMSHSLHLYSRLNFASPPSSLTSHLNPHLDSTMTYIGLTFPWSCRSCWACADSVEMSTAQFNVCRGFVQQENSTWLCTCVIWTLTTPMMFINSSKELNLRYVFGSDSPLQTPYNEKYEFAWSKLTFEGFLTQIAFVAQTYNHCKLVLQPRATYSHNVISFAKTRHD